MSGAARKGRFKKEVDVGLSLSADRRSKVKKIVKKGEGDRGDQRRAPVFFTVPSGGLDREQNHDKGRGIPLHDLTIF